MTTWLHGRIIPLAALVALFAIGCSGGNPQAAATQSSAPASPQVSQNKTTPAGAQDYDCAALISEKEIDQLTGLSGAKLFSASRNQEELVPGYTECAYSLPGDISLVISVWPSQALDSFDVSWDLFRDQGAEPVSGIGDGALLNEVLGGPVLFVRAKGSGVRVNGADLQGSGKLDVTDLVKRVAAIVVGRV